MAPQRIDSSRPDIPRMTKKHYRELLASLPEGVGITDLDENLIFVNDAFAKMLDYDLDELRGQNVNDLIPESEKEKLQQATASRLEGTSSAYELKMIRKDGKQIVVRVSAVPRKDENDDVIGTIAMVIDITKDSLVEQELRKLSRAVEQSPTSVVITDAEARIEYVNPRFSVLTGYSISEVIGENPRVLKSGLTPDDTYTELWSNLLEGKAWRGLFVNKKKTGELYWEDAWISPIFNSEGHITHYVAVKEDITQRIEAEQRATQSRRDLELYASFLQHDIRNDLQIIMNHIEAALLLVTDNNAVKEYLTTAEATSERIVHLLDVFGRPGAADERDLLKLLKKVKSQAEKAHPNLAVEINTDTQDTELRSARLIPIVFDNLLRNSVEYSEGNVKVTIQISRNGDRIQIDHSDDGPGIDADIREGLFQKGTSTTGGGFGLYLSKKVIEGYGGSIEFIDTKETGTTFRIILPAA
ncbi:MAG: PAS domain S-box protein [Candidatus Thorarchaeota archaeon]